MLNYKEILNNAQYEAVTAKEPRLLFLAGAGTGKTHTMMYRTMYLIENGVKPENILLLTFTNKAAHEMVERLEKLGAKNVTACTFHSFCVKELRQYVKDFSVLSQSDEEEIIRMHRPKNFPVDASKLASVQSYSINKKISVREAIIDLLGWDYAFLAEPIEDLYAECKEYRAAHRMLSYDELLTEFIKYLKDGMKLNRHYSHIMVDEYQDTNSLQDEILELINPENLAVVGDDCQSLYAFRGAEVKNIIDFPSRHNARVIKIERNYRSNQAILDLSNEMMKDFSQEGIPKWLTAENAYGNAPVLHRPGNQMDEADYILRQIKEWEGDPSELCVLVRTARTSSYLEAKLAAEKIPFEKRGGPKFFELSHIKDILSLFELTKNQNNQIAWFRVLMLIRNIGTVNARKIADSLSMGENVEKYKTKTYYKDLCEILNKLSYKAEWHERLNYLMEYYVELSARNIVNSKSERKEELMQGIFSTIKPDLDLLKSVAAGFKSDDEFLDDLLTSNIPNIENDDQDKFIISTIHSAKGLEFDYVILMGAAEGVFPREYTDEELRCMYVALTRPRKYLLVTSPMYYVFQGKNRYVNVPVWLDKLAGRIEF